MTDNEDLPEGISKKTKYCYKGEEYDTLVHAQYARMRELLEEDLTARVKANHWDDELIPALVNTLTHPDNPDLRNILHAIVQLRKAQPL